MANEIALKACSKCKTENPIETYHKSSVHKDGRHPYCKKCRTAYYKIQWSINKDNPEFKRIKKQRDRANHLKRNYNMTTDDYESMSLKQDGVCFVCRQPEMVQPQLVVDHNHETGDIRKLLDTPCNTVLGLVGESPERLRALADYLEAHYR